MTDIATFIGQMPKAELHLHIEGALEPYMMMALANRNGVKLAYASVEEIEQAYKFDCLQDFLDLYYQGMSVLLTAQDFFDLTWAYLKRVHSENVTHVEIFFDPQGHTSRGVPFETVLSGITDALDQAADEFGMSHRLIMSFLRHLSENDAFETLEMALPHRDRIFGVGLDSSEMGHPPSKFERVFAAAVKAGFIPVAHAGEEGPPEYVREALDVLNVARIDHGNRALEDAALVERIARADIALTVCPLSNLRLCVVDDMAHHPIRRMLEAGLRATINSDDPAYFGGYMNENYLAVANALSLTQDEVAQLGRNAWLASFLDAEAKQKALKEFDNFIARAT
jgi:adenosine deaminase